MSSSAPSALKHPARVPPTCLYASLCSVSMKMPPPPVAICRLGVHQVTASICMCVCVCVDTCWLFCPIQQQIDFRLCFAVVSWTQVSTSTHRSMKQRGAGFPEQVAHDNDNITGAHCFASFSSVPAVMMWKQQVAGIHECLWRINPDSTFYIITVPACMEKSDRKGVTVEYFGRVLPWW